MFIDRAGLAVSDGATHHGIFDVAFLSHIPNVQILAPSDYNAMRHSVRYAYNCDGPIAVRYSNTAESQVICDHFRYLSEDNWIKLDFDPSDPPKNIFLTYGTIAEKVVGAKKILENKGIDAGIVLIERIKPYLPTVEFIKTLVTDGTHFVYVEEGIKLGGAGVNTREMLGNLDTLPLYRFDVAAIDDQFAYPDSPCDLYDYVGLSAQKIANYFDK
jgi:1-deoxy-D-xylulose-5-phosphate synthase